MPEQEESIQVPTPEQQQAINEAEEKLRKAQEENPQPENPDPEPVEPYGKIIYLKNGAKTTGTEVEDADIVIEDATVPIIVKDRNGLIGVLASPELIDYAEVIE
jgi:hypothetical protein